MLSPPCVIRPSTCLRHFAGPGRRVLPDVTESIICAGSFGGDFKKFLRIQVFEGYLERILGSWCWLSGEKWGFCSTISAGFLKKTIKMLKKIQKNTKVYAFCTKIDKNKRVLNTFLHPPCANGRPFAQVDSRFRLRRTRYLMLDIRFTPALISNSFYCNLVRGHSCAGRNPVFSPSLVPRHCDEAEDRRSNLLTIY